MRGFSLICAIAVLLAAMADPAPALAQTTIRIEPFPVTIYGPERTKKRDVSIWVDNIPSPGLGSFFIHLDAFPRDPLDPNVIEDCMTVESATLDPNLDATWNRLGADFLSVADRSTEAFWRGWTQDQSGSPLPTGTFRLGHITYIAKACGRQREFWLNPDVTKWGSSLFPDLFFERLQGAPWIAAASASSINIDVTVTCNRLSPAGTFVDGDLLSLDCLVSNLGTTGFGMVPPLLMTVASDDNIFDPNTDNEIGRSVGAGVFGGGETRQLSISAHPILRTPGTFNICTKIDVDLSRFEQGWGVKWETDETNNLECSPLTVTQAYRDMVIVPSSVSLTPDPREPAGLFRAGLDFQVSFDVHNQGSGPVRLDHSNRVLIGADFFSATADPNAELCSAGIDPNDGLPLFGGDILTESFGLGMGVDPNRCKIPFQYPPGTHDLFIQLDAGETVIEIDPNTLPDPAENNNVLAVPITVTKPLDPQFRVQHKALEPGDQRVEIFGPATGTVLLAVASATGLTSYSFDLSWSPPGLLSLGDPNLPGGDPTQVLFRDFLEQGGLTHSCSVTSVDQAGGRIGIACTTTNPGGTGTAAWTELSTPVLDITFTPLLPGGGTFTISNLSASDGARQPFNDLTISDGTFFIDGQPELSVLNPIPAPAAWPGVDFSVSLDLMNDGFGRADPPLLTELIVSRDPNNDPFDAFSPDLKACTLAETVSLPGKTTVGRTVTTCRIRENIRPGLYTGFFQVQNLLDVTRRSSATIPFPARVLSLRKSSKGRSLEVRRHPTTPGDASGPAMVSGKKMAARSVASVKSELRNRNWMVRLHRPKGRRGELLIERIPLELNAKIETLRDLRVTRDVKKAMAGADIDGDGEDELMLLLRSKKNGDSLDFRRIDFLPQFPSICPSAAVTPGFGEKILSAAGVQTDADPEDEIAIVTRDGVLTVYDLVLAGAVPPAEPCLGTPRPFILLPPATANLVPIGSDTGFSVQGDRVRSICALDYDLDGTDEIASLHDTGGGLQALRISAPPAAMGGAALLLADDPEFGGTGGGGKVLHITCTR